MYAACFGINGLMAENCKQPQNVPYWPTYKPHISSRDQSWVSTLRLINHFSTAYNQDVTESPFMLFYEFRISLYLNLSSDKTKTSKVSQLHHKFLYENSLRAVLIADEYIKVLRFKLRSANTIKVFGTNNLQSSALYYLIGGKGWWRRQDSFTGLSLEACWFGFHNILTKWRHISSRIWRRVDETTVINVFRASCRLIFSILQKSLNVEAETHSETPIHIYQ